MMKLEINAEHYELTDAIKDYVEKKIGKLDRYLPRHARKTAFARVVLRENQSKNNNRFECEAHVDVPKDKIIAKEATVNMFAAVDIVEEKLKTQFRNYKEYHTDHHVPKKQIFNRLRMMIERPDEEE